MRIENIADVFDSDGEVIYQQVNVEQLAINLFEVANPNAGYQPTLNIQEMALTANQSYEEMSQRRLKWKTVDDSAEQNLVAEDNLRAAQFQQQRIRTFKVSYTLKEEQFL